VGGAEADRRFKSLFTRAADPTETVPFGTYDRWHRSQCGEVTGFETGDEYIQFDPTEGAIEEGRAGHEWESMSWGVRRRLAELELIRDAAFARYRLRELDSWDAVRNTLHWKPSAFGELEA
jgi:hypothetical protein